ncbi:MAG TPA: 3-hydroxyacyl-CoA dehydrogenase NAD-binding domain-containing protein [Candidatus Desulfobacillus sp.]|nr:3-hydroxyacyl-CoA dehydrogenase NAD-binding domain-containing protein [Candidatus Desulfobacillus sp.]
MTQAAYSQHGSIAVISMDNPPVNGLGFELRSGLVAGLDRAMADAAVQAVVLIGTARAFSGGADIREFNSPKALAEPNLNTVIRIVEAASKPVIAAISGACMGGGLELALGCHFRVAAAGAQIALPEVKLGILPGAGGTQRLPRLIGPEAALNMIVTGAVVPSEQLKDTPLFDAFIEGDLLAGALAFAEKAVKEKRGLPRVRDLKIDYPNAAGFFQFARNTVGALSKNFPAPLKCVDAVAAAVAKPFDEGMRLEREAFMHLVQTSESKALRHAFFGERAAAKIADVPEDTPTRKIAKVGIIGAGTMGGGIAMNFLNAGIPVALLEVKQEALEKGVATIRKNYEGSLKKGRLTPEKLAGRMELLRPTLSYDDLGDCDLVIEAVFEDIGVKEQVFRKLDEVARPGAILASNTSTLDVNRIAGFTRRPQDVLGMHFFSPANVMKLLEVVRGAATAKDVLATVMQLARKIRKTAVIAGVCDGFIGNRMIDHYGRIAGFLVEEGATPWQVDRALEKWGMMMGPFRMSDLAGNDIGWAIRKRRYVENPEIRYSRIADEVCELGRFGQKTGAGWYRYEAGKRDALPDPDIEKLIADFRQKHGIAPRKIADAEIVERCIYALVNEGARILEEGIAQRASDIDMVYLTGYGFPLHRGGPMLYADQVGLYNVARAAQRFAAESGDAFWQPAPLLARLAAEGKTFN